MNHFEEKAEQLLTNLSALKSALANLEERRQRLIASGAPQEIKALNLQKENSGVRAANDTFDNLLEVAECSRLINYTRTKIEGIESVMDQLPDEYKKLINLWYVKNFTKEHIMSEMHIGSLSTAYALRKKAVKEFAMRYYGASALSSI